MSMILAQAVGGGIATWGIVHWIVVIIAVIGAIAVLYVFLDWMGFKIPPQMIKIFWICVAVVVSILAIKFIASQL